jgi:hypothetical protein
VAGLEREGGEERKKERRGGRNGLTEPLCPKGRQSRWHPIMSQGHQ